MHCSTPSSCIQLEWNVLNNNTTRTRRRGNSEPAITLTPGQTILQEREQILKSEEKVQNGIFYVIDAVNRRVDHLPKRKFLLYINGKHYISSFCYLTPFKKVLPEYKQELLENC